MDITLLRLSGKEARKYVHELATLRLKVFWEFPYLYEGSLDYEKNYLETYFKAEQSLVVILKAFDRVIGATTCIWAHEEVPSFKEPFIKAGLDPKNILYFGESVILPEWRGKGLGKKFFEEREQFARSLQFIDALAFCAVIRDSHHHLRPKDYRPLDEFWISQGFRKIPNLVTEYEWQDRDEAHFTKKKMQFWMKNLKDNHVTHY